MSLVLLRKLTALAVLTLSPLAANAQSGIPWCENAQNGSVQGAFQLIQQGDAILNQLSDCSQVNLMACEEALNYYREAERQIADVFLEAKGEACTWCDITPVGDVAEELAIRGDHFTQALGWDVDLRRVWKDFETWQGAPYCDVPGWQGNAQPGAQPGPAVGKPPAASNNAGCGTVDSDVGLYLPDGGGSTLQNVTADVCQSVCDTLGWCRSFTANIGARVCEFHSATRREVPLLSAHNTEIIHYTCLGR